MNVTLDMRIEETAWSDEISGLDALCARALEAGFSIAGKPGEVALLLTDDAEMHQLNRDWRGKDKPTDVLSFPADEMEAPFLGDVAIGYGVASTDARARNITLADHLSHLLVHGYFHLIGYDHMEDEEARIMEDLEVRALASLGIADPYSPQS